MRSASPLAQRLALQVLLDEAGGAAGPAPLAAAAERVSARLGERLAGLFGQAGYQALLTRALRLARANEPGLDLVTVNIQANGNLRGLPEFAAQAGDPALALAGLTALLAELIGLLESFIGAALTVRLMREGWPDRVPEAHEMETLNE